MMRKTRPARKFTHRPHEKGMKAPRPHKEGVLRVFALGGLNEIGRNMMCFEYGDEIVIIDMGLQFPEEETPGVDYIIPNINYLEPKKKNVKAVILTHGHYDHIGAIPYLIGKLGNPTIYCTELTKAIIEKRQEEFSNAPKLDVEVIKNLTEVQFSKHFGALFFGVDHSIPETTGVMLKTPVGNLVHFADFRIDYDAKGEPARLDEFEKIGRKGILAFFIDSTNAEEEGKSLSERVIEKNLEDLFKNAKGRIIVATFASMLTRIIEMISIAEKLGRKVALNGRSMVTNVEIARQLGYLKAKKGTIIPVTDLPKYKDDKILIVSTGAQGEPNAGLMRIANGEHRQIQIKKGDTMIFSSSVIPGNERGVQILRDNMTRQGAKVYHSKIIDIHVSGHAPQEELETVMKLIKPKFVVPVHGYYVMRATNCEVAEKAGIPRDRCAIIDNGQVMELTKDTVEPTDETVDSYYVMVDGLGVGDVGEVVMRDRRMLAEEGMIVIIATLDRKSGRFLKSPDIISRGFIYLRENKELVEEMRKKIRGIIERIPRHQTLEPEYVKALIRDQIGSFVYRKTKRRPMVLPVVIEV